MVSKYLPSILENIIKLDINSNIFFNINFPNINFKELKGCKVVKAGKRKPGEISKIIKSKSDNFYLYIPSERKIHKTASSNEDEYELKKNLSLLPVIQHHSIYKKKCLARFHFSKENS